MYIIVELELNYGEHELFFETMPKVKALMEADGGPRMLAGFINTLGQMFRCTHIWQADTAAQYMDAITRMMTHADFPPVMAALKKAAAKETLMFAEQTPYSPNLLGR